MSSGDIAGEGFKRYSDNNGCISAPLKVHGADFRPVRIIST